MNAPRLVAGVDSSTQSTKVLVIDADSGETVREGRAPHPDGTEVDPEHWWQALLSATSGGLLDGVDAIGVGGQQHGMVALDETGNVVRPALLWNDTRSAGSADKLVEELGGGDAWAEAVGSVPVAAFTISKLRWMAEHEPKSASRTTEVLLPHDWLTARLIDQSQTAIRSGSATTDRGDASGTGYWSPLTGEYRPDLVKLALGHEIGLPEVLAPDAVAGTTESGVVVSAGTGDNMAAALGLGHRPGRHRRLARHQRDCLRGARPAVHRRFGDRRGFRRCHREVPAAGLHVERRTGAERRPPTCSAPTSPASTDSPWPALPVHTACRCFRISTANEPPTCRRHWDPEWSDPSQHHT